MGAQSDRGEGVGVRIIGAAAQPGENVTVAGFAIAGRIDDLEAVERRDVDPPGDGIDVRFEEIAGLGVIGHIIPRLVYRCIARTGPRRARNIAAQIGRVVRGQVVIIEHQFEGVARLERRRDGCTVALAVGEVAVGHFLIAVEQVGAHRDRVGQRHIGVERDAVIVVGADARIHARELVIGAGLLGDRIDRAASRAATREARARPLGDLDLVDREGFARGHARIAQTVDEDIAARFMAADDVAVAEGVAVLARTHGHAGDIVEHVAQIGRALFLELLLGQHLDRLRGFRQWLHAAQIARSARLVGHARLRVRIDVGGSVFDLQRVEDDFVFVIGILCLGVAGDERCRQADGRHCSAPSGTAQADRADHALVTIPHGKTFLIIILCVGNSR